MATRKAQQLLSGQQIIRPNGQWDRVFGVIHPIDGAPEGKVLVTTESRRAEPFDQDEEVEIV
jgi:hypothetical protein